jgi:nitrate reductase NapE component
MNNFAIIGMLLFFLFALGFVGMRGFLRRVIS